MKIIREADGGSPSVSQTDIHSFIEDNLDNLLQDEKYKSNFHRYIISYLGRIRENNNNELNKFKKNNPFYTLSGTEVKSNGAKIS